MNCILCGTPHFDFVANECVKRLSQVNLEYEIPVAFGVLTEDTIERAIELAGIKAGNKGEEAEYLLQPWMQYPC